MTSEPAKISASYAMRFGWKIDHRPEVNDRIAATRRKVVAAGGTIHVEEQAVPGMGSLSLFTDPEGRMMGLWKSAEASQTG